MAPKCLMLNISATVRDSDLASTDHQYERTICGSTSHMTDDIK